MDLEAKFLNDIADELNITGKAREVFLVCFASRNQNLTESDIAKQIPWGISAITPPVQSMNPHLSKIYPLLEQQLNCPKFPQGNGQGNPWGDNGKLKHYSTWMWETKYAEYLADRPTIIESDSSNPFSDRVRIEDPTRFFGRTEFLRQLQEDLQKGMSLALVGETQIGKSSILQYLYRRGKHQWRGKASKFIYMDMQLIDRDEDFQSALCHHFGIETNCSMFQLDRELKRRGQKYILCLDEVEMLSHELFSFKVRANLCGLANGDSAPLILVTATRSPLSIIFPDRPTETSPLASLCQQRDVLSFTEQETIDFIHLRLEPTGVKFSDRDIEKLYQQTNGHPGQLQQAAADLFDLVASALPNQSTNPQAT
jgi:hypothetical protein